MNTNAGLFEKLILRLNFINIPIEDQPLYCFKLIVFYALWYSFDLNEC